MVTSEIDGMMDRAMIQRYKRKVARISHKKNEWANHTLTQNIHQDEPQEIAPIRALSNT